MKIGIPKEIKNNENRVSITPWGVKELVKNNHEVIVEKNAGLNSGFSDEDYKSAGAIITDDVEKIWSQDLILKVKEPLSEEYSYFRENQIIFTYLHLAANKELTEKLIDSKVIAIAYETIEVNRELPLLKPMSEIAGRRSVLYGASLLEKHKDPIHQGILITSVPGVEKANIVIVGGGVAGLNAAQIAIGINANVTVLEINEQRIRYLDETLNHKATILKSNHNNLSKAIKTADLVISTILLPGAKAPKIITTEMVKSMKPGSVIIDIAIDQGGSVETITNSTTHDDPYFILHDVIHSAVANIPGIVPQTSTIALTNATLPYVNLIANNGLKTALEIKKELISGINTYLGHITYQQVATTFDKEYTSVENLIK